jgi:tetratricopeptide (TPR) repeat protein
VGVLLRDTVAVIGDTSGVGNEVSAAVSGAVVQARSIRGDVHFHQSDRMSVIPRQLPVGPRHFVGREAELTALNQVVQETAEGAGTVVISAINGTAGIGKTAMAVRWAHQVADRFTDGQLYVNLRGFDPASEPMAPAEAVRGFLDAFEIPPERIPVSLDAQAALYRSLLAGRRVLVVLDNARDAEQVRPLLPGSPTCLVVITSRNRLGSLVAQEQARSITLDVLNEQESLAMLTLHIGAERVAAESSAISELIEYSAGLPLALAIVVARTATNPDFPLRVLANELRDEYNRLDAFDTGDLGKDMRAVFSWSYRTLSPLAACLFRLLGLHAGPDICLPAAASLMGLPTGKTRALLTELTRAHLLGEHSPGRYRFHDLLRAYAVEQGMNNESEPQRQAALHRVLDHYLHTGMVADHHLHPHREQIALAAPRPGVGVQPIGSYQQAMEWFTTEHANLLAAIDDAASKGFDVHAWQLPWALDTYLDRRGHWHDYAVTQQTALAATGRLGDRAAQARTHRDLGWAYARLGRYDDGLDHHREALTIWRDLDDRDGQADTHHALGWACERQERYYDALEHAQQAWALSRETGRRSAEVHALSHLTWNLARLGYHQHALAECHQDLERLRELDDRIGEAHMLDCLGYAHHHLGEHDRALAYYQQALALWRALGDHYYEADILTHIGDTHHASGHDSIAFETWQQALGILDRLAHPDAVALRHKLAELDRRQCEN